MKKTSNLIAFLLCYVISVMIAACSSDTDSDIVDPVVDQEEQPLITPSNLTLSLDVVGSGSNSPYGDGSGIVNFVSNAKDAVSYGFIINNKAEQKSTTGTYQYVFDDIEGVENHEIKVIAYSSTDIAIYKEKTARVAYYIGDAPFWAEEFFENGAPNPLNWNYNIGAGGWGNNELQTYTKSQENVFVQDGLLKIKAKSDGAGGFTSARIKSENLFEFTYGTVEVRAKLPASKGTWPAIWMLGANFDSVGWPACGEIDIMEQKGWDKDKVLATCHWSNNGSYAGYGLETTVNNSSNNFHVYKLEWIEGGSIKASVDNKEYFVMTTDNGMPFKSNFFFILNVAMGGNLGGDIDASFTEDTMEIDYIRVYQ